MAVFFFDRDIYNKNARLCKEIAINENSGQFCRKLSQAMLFVLS